MGQYWKPVNLDKREYLHAHRMGDGLKLWKQLGGGGLVVRGVGVLIAAMPQPRGGGDIPADPIVGRWAGDRIAFIGDYALDSDLPDYTIPASLLYGLCSEGGLDDPDAALADYPSLTREDLRPFTDISAQVKEYLQRLDSE